MLVRIGIRRIFQSAALGFVFNTKKSGGALLLDLKDRASLQSRNSSSDGYRRTGKDL